MTDEANPKDALGDKKVNLALVAPASIIHEAMAMENGAKKYGPYNWRTKKVRTMVYVAAGLRHLLEYLDGADFSTDTDPPVHHLGHAKACLGIVLDAMETGNLIDDRPKKSEAATRLVSRNEEIKAKVVVKCDYCKCGKLKPLGHESCGCGIRLDCEPQIDDDFRTCKCIKPSCSWHGSWAKFDQHFATTHLGVRR